jgi:hypothetical protein
MDIYATLQEQPVYVTAHFREHHESCLKPLQRLHAALKANC